MEVVVDEGGGGIVMKMFLICFILRVIEFPLNAHFVMRWQQDYYRTIVGKWRVHNHYAIFFFFLQFSPDES